MSYLSENVIPGSHGKTFGTNAKTGKELEKILHALINIGGIKDIIIKTDTYPREFTIHSSTVIAVREIQNKIRSAGFHAIPKRMLLL
ncbi:MAG: heavy-metal-associated domain-containing protein [Crocinitomicaceae bacterium]|nr:heavy-metal-associated domain-containing protein [Crocinitomicaceae bacterium]